MESLSLTNICRGAVEEVFNREVTSLLKNIKDPNTRADQKRKIKLEFDFVPFEDRSGAEVSFKISSSMASIAPIKGTIFVAQATEGLKAYPRDPRQDALFDQGAPVSKA